MPATIITYPEFAENVRRLFNQVNKLLTNKTPLPPKLEARDEGYTRYQKLSGPERQPYLQLFDKLQLALNTDAFTQLIEQYKVLQPLNNPNFSDKIAISSEEFDLYREIQGLSATQSELLLQLKYLLDVKENLDFVDKFGERFADKEALKIRQLNDYIPLYTCSSLKAIVNEYLSHHGFLLAQSDTDSLSSHECAKLGFADIVLPATQSKAAVQLYRIAVAESNSQRDTGPLLSLNIALIQQYSVNNYMQKFKTILDAQPANKHFSVLSATDNFFQQTALSSAIGIDNTHAAIALIQLINISTALSPEQKQTLLNHCSKNINPGWEEETYSSTPLLLAIQRGNKKVVDLLLSTHCIDVNKPDLNHLAPLDWAFIMADAELMLKLLEQGAAPTKAYYQTHPWKEEIWQPSDDMLERISRLDERFFPDHPERRQLIAHYWDNEAKFYQTRYYNPQAKLCDELLHPTPVPAMTTAVANTSSTTIQTTASKEPETLPDLFKPDFQQCFEALVRRQQQLSFSAQQADKDLAQKMAPLMNIFKAEANIFVRLLQSNSTQSQKQEALQQFKTDIQAHVFTLQQDIQAHYPAQKQQLSDHLIMLLNDFLNALSRFCSRIGNLLSKNQQPHTTKPYIFFEDKISTERLVKELGDADAIELKKTQP